MSMKIIGRVLSPISRLTKRRPGQPQPSNPAAANPPFVLTAANMEFGTRKVVDARRRCPTGWALQVVSHAMAHSDHGGANALLCKWWDAYRRTAAKLVPGLEAVFRETRTLDDVHDRYMTAEQSAFCCNVANAVLGYRTGQSIEVIDKAGEFLAAASTSQETVS